MPFAELPRNDERWLQVAGSMTRTIAETFRGAPRVTPTLEGVGEATDWEARLVALRGNHCHVREVTIDVAGRPLLLARTLTDLDDPAVTTLRRLARQPLADVLFGDSGWKLASERLALSAVLEGTRCYGRASVWQHRAWRASRLLVTELFLPALVARAPLELLDGE